MWVHIDKIAKEHRIPEEPLVALAMKNPFRYSVIIDSQGPKVERAKVDQLIAEFRSLAAAQSLPGS